MLSECRSPKHIGPGQPRHPLTWQDVREAVRKIGVPRARVDGPAFTLVNLRTTFSTHAATIDRTVVILGFHVDLHIVPTTYLWHWGDGTTSTTHVAGRPYPAHDVTHTYHRATRAGHSLPLRVDVAYRADFRVDGGSWRHIAAVLVVAGTTRRLPIKQASGVLVPGN